MTIANTNQATDASARKPHIAFNDREAVLNEIACLAGGVTIHAGMAKTYAEIGHMEGLDLAIKDTRSCLIKMIEFRKGLADA